MRDVNGIDRILRELEPHWAEVEEEFERSNREFLRMAAIDHDPIGRVLRSHLIIENFLTRYLQQGLRLTDIAQARLSFAQKIALLPDGHDSAAFVKRAILELNAVRNKFGHRLDYEVRRKDLNAVYEVLSVARRGERFRDPVAAIEAFTTVACAFLIVPSEHLREVFGRAFRRFNVDRSKPLEDA